MLVRVMFFTLLHNLFYTSRSVTAPLSLTLSAYCLSKSQSHDSAPKRIPLIDSTCCGEDDFIAQRKDSISLLAVADGVGGWNNKGINPKIFTSALVTNIRTQFSINSASPLSSIVDVAMKALEGPNSQVKNGSCTLCMVAVDVENRKCRTYNLGDSGYIVYRNGNIVEQSTEKQVYFNAPYQLGFSNGIPIENPPGDENTFSIQPDDVIVVGSDGLFDNLFESDMKRIIKSVLSSNLKSTDAKCQAIARDLVVAAKKAAVLPNGKSPFAEKAVKSGYYYVGGKNDDTTVVVGIVDEKGDGYSSFRKEEL